MVGMIECSILTESHMGPEDFENLQRMKEQKVNIVASYESEFEVQKSKFGRRYEEIILVIHPWGPRYIEIFMYIPKLSCVEIIVSH